MAKANGDVNKRGSGPGSMHTLMLSPIEFRKVPNENIAKDVNKILNCI
jgi:hypothetical protein